MAEKIDRYDNNNSEKRWLYPSTYVYMFAEMLCVREYELC